MSSVRRTALIAFLFAIAFSLASVPTASAGTSTTLKRPVPSKPVYKSLANWSSGDRIVVKLNEGMGQPEFNGGQFLKQGADWDKLNALLASPDKSQDVRPRFTESRATLNRLRDEGMKRSGKQLPDLSLYYQISLPPTADAKDAVAMLNELNKLDIVEIAYAAPKPSLATAPSGTAEAAQATTTPEFESGQYYLRPAPTGLDAYYAWGFPGGKGDNIKVVDIEGNWIQTHEDLHGGTDNFHIAGSVISDPGWWNHGTAVLGEIAADSNNFGMTGIAFNVSLGTVSIGSMSTAEALVTAMNNTSPGDIILIELHAPGPHYNFQDRTDQAGYVAMEYWQENFDAIYNACAAGRIVVEAAGNGGENYDDVSLYGFDFDPSVRFSGAVMVGASYSNHTPAGFSNYGQRVDVHGFGTWDVYSLAYGDLWGSSDNNFYTSSFSGTSSASPIIVGACACIEGVQKAVHGFTLDQAGLHQLLTTYGTPQAASSHHIGPLPDLRGAVNEVMGVAFTADTTIGWAPLAVQFTGSSGLTVDSWTWAFGDGDSSTTQSPAHTYQTSGMFDVSLQVVSGSDTRAVTRQNFIVSLGDTIRANTASAPAGQQVEIDISANNTIPLDYMRIPVTYAGPANLSFDSMSVVGCRTAYFEEVGLLNYDGFNRRITIKLQPSTSNTQPDLSPGNGLICKLFFTPTGASGQTSPIVLAPYSSYALSFQGPLATYDVPSIAGGVSVTTCTLRGDVDGSMTFDIADLIYMVDYSFNNGPDPFQIEAADVDCSGTVDIADLIYMADFMFSDGPPPCGC
jgi:hypothetical protein